MSIGEGASYHSAALDQSWKAGLWAGNGAHRRFPERQSLLLLRFSNR
jgi:hypothetical protein